MKRLDSVERSDPEADQEDEASEKGDVYRKQLDVAFKTLQILGQIVKNFPGSMSGDDKRRLVTECIGIGLRTLGSLFAILEASSESFVRMMIGMLKDVDPNLTNEELSKKARQSSLGSFTWWRTVLSGAYRLRSDHRISFAFTRSSLVSGACHLLSLSTLR